MSFDNTTFITIEEPAETAPTPTPPPSPSCRNRTWQAAEGQKETAVRLDRLPPGLAFPDDFPEPVRYDAGRQLLLYRGFMYHGSYTFLHELNSDAQYLAAVDRLYLASSCTTSAGRPWGRWLAAALATGATAAGAAWWFLR